MGFTDVYKALRDIFAQESRLLVISCLVFCLWIDARVLRAVAIEHSKDFDAAVEAVLDDIIPFFDEKSGQRCPLTGSISVGESSEDALVGTQTEDRENRHGNNETFIDAYDRNWEGEHNAAALTLSERTHENAINLSGDVYSHGEPVGYIDNNGEVVLHLEASIEPETEEIISGDIFPESSIKMSSDMGVDQTGPLETEFGRGINQENDQESSAQLNATMSKLTNTASRAEIMSKTFGTVDESILDASMPQSTDAASKAETMSDNVGIGDESTLKATMPQSIQIHMIDVLDEIVSDAKNNKKILFSSLESVIGLMRQVERKEQAAEVAKEEAAMGGTNILNKVEELKQILQHANKANQMHAGEVDGEKAILMAELSELQARVLSLSDERDNSLGVLDEMRQSLVFRLATAENEIKAAEQEKLEKEMAARRLLADQEYIMEQVVQESNILKQQTEDNAKLQEFLVDRGRVVDMLQGEIAVICQDVKLLKEKFDETGSLSKSLSSSRINFIKASSDSSLKSLISDQTEPVPSGDESSEAENETDHEKVSEDESSETEYETDHEKVSEDEASGDDREALLDDGWDFLDNREIDDTCSTTLVI